MCYYNSHFQLTYIANFQTLAVNFSGNEIQSLFLIKAEGEKNTDTNSM
jgi:hypothetical protein